MHVLTECKMKYRTRRGFTMAEALLAVAILVILFALLAPNLIRLRKELRQKELDAKAEILYVAVQNQLSKLRASGNASLYAGADARAIAAPLDALGIDGASDEVRYYYFSSFGRSSGSDAAALAVMTPEAVDAALLEHAWVIEYVPASGTVHAVFYSEKRDLSDYPRAGESGWERYDKSLRDRSERLKDGALVGYYGGEAQVFSGGETQRLSPTITVMNGETLKVRFECIAPDDLVFTLTVTDGSVTNENISLPVKRLGLSHYYYSELTLDDLGNGQRFRDNAYCAGMTPGSNLKLTLTVTASQNAQMNKATATAVVNSLFADYDGMTAGPTTVAYIRYGRHLQNLDESSGVANITAAEQLEDISFTRSDDQRPDWQTWQKCYNGDTPATHRYFNGYAEDQPRFQPIRNAALTSYNGMDHTIAGLNAGCDDAERSSGLFSCLPAHTALERVTLTGARTDASARYAGGLAGVVRGEACSISGCGVYLTQQDRKSFDYPEKFPYLIGGGAAAGGLVGTVSAGGGLTIEDSYAATTVRADAAGGLVGLAAGELEIASSYADCYIAGAATGGLVGGGTVGRIEDSYAAGFLLTRASDTDTTAAGLVNGSVGQMERCYTVCDLGRAKKTWATAPSYHGTPVYYFDKGSVAEGQGAISLEEANLSTRQLASLLGGEWNSNSPLTEFYNLMHNGLDSSYSYPGLKTLTHRGDWKTGFQPGSLVYYELYDGGRCGFTGGGVTSTLRNDLTLRGDGYGIAFKANSTGTAQATVENDPNGTLQVTLGAGAYYTVTAPGVQYRVYPLARNTVNAMPEETGVEGFWRKAEIRYAINGQSEKTLTYWFNPLFADVKLQSEIKPTAYPDDIEMRSPRQLNALSMYHNGFWNDLECLFTQPRDIRYADYGWNQFGALGKTVAEQEPIGNEACSFRCSYNGDFHIISGVSFVSVSGERIGLFGTTAETGEIYSIVVAAEYDADAATPFRASRRSRIPANKTAHMGVLVGHNRGKITNCAVAGYSVTGGEKKIYADINSTVYVGGLVGCNDGTIRDCSAVFPEIGISATFSKVAVGGLVGLNRGVIQNCYAIGHLTAEARGDEAQQASVLAGGFAGSSTGSISSSYCAVSLVIGGASDARGFAFSDVSPRSCYYLNNGAFYYQSRLQSYIADDGGAEGVDYETLTRQSWTAQASSRDCCAATTADASVNYPFRSVVRNRNGYVHYGDWQIKPELGTLGVFYWEKEEGGSNAGYHFSFRGTQEGEYRSGTTLCTEHDDGGRITEYGYGYYVDRLQSDKITPPTGVGIVYRGVNYRASAALGAQMDGYCFYAYTTGYSADPNAACLYPEGDRAFGVWQLSFDDGTEVHTYSYTISPFFANAVVPGYYTDPKSENAPGGAKHPFEVRSAEQLQYINWNHVTHSCTELVTGEKGKAGSGNYQQFPYLQYATQLTLGIQKREDVEAKRPPRHWKQTHDLHGDGLTHTPIAGMATSTPVSNGKYQNILFAWFGGSYDGQSYKIQNLSVKSKAFTVGLFGVTAGADIRNIIMYSSTGAHYVERNTRDEGYADFDRKVGAYNLGGLIGIAYEYYFKDAAVQITNKIENCAIAGYQVIDRSSNQQGAGTANIGGLIGLANVNLNRCSAVTEILIDSTHQNGHMAWGSYLRVGGLAGSAGAPGNKSVAVTNCYTGGSIQVSDTTLHEDPERYENGFALRDKDNVGYSTNIFIAGVICGSYAPNISNFTSQESNAPDGTANLSNCYTYLRLPNLEGNIRAVSYVANKGDRYNRKSVINLSNCFYLKEVNEDITHEPFTYFFKQNSKKQDMTDKDFEAILNGDLLSLTTYLNKQSDGGAKEPNAPVGVTYEQLTAQQMVTGWTDAQGSHLLGDAWSWVTVTEGKGDNAARIDGKYSFSDKSAQTGKNYPFPTCVEQLQKDQNADPIYVHYGAWPVSGAYWTNGRDRMDIFDAMQEGDTWAEKPFTLHFQESTDLGQLTELSESYDAPRDAACFTATFTRAVEGADPEETVLRFTLSPFGLAEVVGAEQTADRKALAVTLRALRGGSVTLEEEALTGASCVVSITANLSITATPSALRLVGGEVSFTCRAESVTNQNDYTDAASGLWSAAPETDDLQTQVSGSHITVQGSVPGDSFVTVTYTYRYPAYLRDAEGAWVLDAAGAKQIDPDNCEPLTVTAVVPVRTMGFIALSDGTSHTALKRSEQEEPEPYPTGDETPVRPQGADVFLFAPAAEGDLSAFTVGEIGISSDYGVDPDTVQVAFYTADGHPVITQDANYQYLGAAVQSSAGEQIVNLTVPVTDPVTGRTYSLTLQNVRAYQERVGFNANGGTGSMNPAGLGAEPVTLPDGGAYLSRTGCRFVGWYTDAAGTGEPVTRLSALDGIDTLFAKWVPITYTVHYAPGLTDRGEWYEETYTYEIPGLTPEEGVTTALPDPTATAPDTVPHYEQAEDYRFTGWNTALDGSGTPYAVGASNLTDSDGGDVWLYAQWAQGYPLTLVSGGEVYQSFDVTSGDRTLREYAAPPAVEGWTFEGWRAKQHDYDVDADVYVPVLDAGGGVAAAVDGITDAEGAFALTGPQTLYAFWSRTAYVQTDALGSGAYLIVGGEPGAQRLLCLDGGKYRGGTVSLRQDALCAENGLPAPEAAWIADDGLEAGTVWTSTPVGDGTYCNLSIGASFLRNNTPELQVSDTGDNNKHRWLYLSDTQALMCEFQKIGAQHSVYWTGSAWKTAAGGQCLIFRRQTVYSFTPD